MKFRNVNVGRGYELENDMFQGLKEATGTARLHLAMEYVQAILVDQRKQIEDLKAQLAAKPEAMAKPGKAKPAPTPKAEDAPAE